jgi:chromosomal replication initiation ATPase DnaA
LPAPPADDTPRAPLLPGAAVTPADDQLDPVWQEALLLLQAQLAADSFTTWIQPSRLLLLAGETAVLGTPNVFVRDELAMHYGTTVAAAVSRVLGRPITLEVVIGTSLAMP